MDSNPSGPRITPQRWFATGRQAVAVAGSGYETTIGNRTVDGNPCHRDHESPAPSHAEADPRAGGVGATDIEGRPRVLIVEDEPDMLELFRHYLDDDYAVRTATNGEEALERFDDTVDVVLLDRRMPGRSGDAVLDDLRDRGFDGPAAMVSAVDPGPAIVDLPVDDYLVKPVSQADLTLLVTTLLRRAHLDEATREYLGTLTKIAILEANHSAAELEDLTEYRDLTDRAAELRDRAKATLGRMPQEEVDQLVRDVD